MTKNFSLCLEFYRAQLLWQFILSIQPVLDALFSVSKVYFCKCGEGGHLPLRRALGYGSRMLDLPLTISYQLTRADLNF